MSQISMFLAQSGPMSMSLVARSTMEPAMGGVGRSALSRGGPGWLAPTVVVADRGRIYNNL
jgi:hypothetical protein